MSVGRGGAEGRRMARAAVPDDAARSLGQTSSLHTGTGTARNRKWIDVGVQEVYFKAIQ